MVELKFYIKKLLDLESGQDWKEIYVHIYEKIHPMIYDSLYLKRNFYIKELERFHNDLIDLPFSQSSSDKLKFRKLQKHIIDLLYQIQEENKKVFIVHGYNSPMIDKVSSFLGKLRLDYVLIEDRNSERRLKEFKKIASECGYAIVLFSADDIGKSLNPQSSDKVRASQNVIFQTGYFLSHVGRKNMIILHPEDKEIESPFDFDDLFYTAFDAKGNWKEELVKEMQDAGIYIDKSLILQGH